MMINVYQHHKQIQMISDFTVFMCFYLFHSHWMSLVTNHIKPYKWYEEGVWSDQFPYYLLIRKWSFSAWWGSTPGWRLLVDICMPHAPPFPRVGAWTFVSDVLFLLVYEKSSSLIIPMQCHFIEAPRDGFYLVDTCWPFFVSTALIVRMIQTRRSWKS